MSKTTKILLAYAAGQLTQLIVHAMCLSNNMYSYKQIPFCAAAGFVLLFAVISGVIISGKRDDRAEHKKSYVDWAKIPVTDDEDEVRAFEKQK